jgi:hypothetical protein
VAGDKRVVMTTVEGAGAPVFLDVDLRNTERCAARVTVAVSTLTGGAWLTADTTELDIAARASATLTLGADPGTLAPALYEGRADFTPRCLDGTSAVVRPIGLSVGFRIQRGDSVLSPQTTAIFDGVVPLSTTWRVLEGGPSPRDDYAAVWTGREFLFWGGLEGGVATNTGAAYAPDQSVWRALAPSPLPAVRGVRAAMFDGRVFFFGGVLADGRVTQEAALYDPVGDHWALVSSEDAPSARRAMSVLSTQQGVIVWGGVDGRGRETRSGALFSRTTGAWQPLSVSGAPRSDETHTAVSTGDGILVTHGAGARIAGAQYALVTDTWSSLRGAGAPAAVGAHASAFTGALLIVATGSGEPIGAYNLGAQRWTRLPASLLDTRRGVNVAFTGRELVVVGGETLASNDGSPAGAIYDFSSDAWRPIPAHEGVALGQDAPIVWSGEELVGVGSLGPWLLR